MEEVKNIEHKHIPFGPIVATIGAILIGIGVAWLIAMNWHDIPAFLKILILVSATAGAYVAGVLFRINNYPKIGGSLLILGALLYTLSIFLIAQIFHISTSLQANAFLWLLAFIGVITAAYVFDSSPSLVIGSIWFLIWVRFQFWVLILQKSAIGFGVSTPFTGGFGRGMSFGLLALLYLAIGVLFYGLNLLHKSYEHKFANIYRWWTAFYFLMFAYILSFQILLPMIWPSGFSAPAASWIFLIIFSLLALVVFNAGIFTALGREKVKGKEIMIFIGIVVLLLIVIFSAALVSNTLGSCRLKSCYDLKTKEECQKIDIPNTVCSWKNNKCISLRCYYYQNQTSCENAPAELQCEWRNNYCDSTKRVVYEISHKGECSKYDNKRKACLSQDFCKWYPQYHIRGKNAPFKLWAIWIIDNIIFLVIILIVIAYGVYQGSTKLVNLGIIFFVLDIITRYIGFVIDFWGYTSLSILFIIGGGILIFGGWFVEKLRRKLIQEAKEHKQNFNLKNEQQKY